MATKSVLIVDDAPETRIFLKGIVNSLGFSHFEAKSGIDALKILKEHPVDLVILDVLMPNFDGYQTLEYINKLKQTQAIKVVFFTGKKGELDQMKIEQLKPDALIHKTVEIQVLKTKLKKLLDGSMTSLRPHVVMPSSPFTSPQLGPVTISRDEKKLDLVATITNMPIALEIKILKLTQSGIYFSAQFPFKEGSLLSIDCPKAANALKKTGDLQVKVHKCTPEQAIFITNALHI